MTDGKALLASKQVWLMILTVAASIFASPEVLNLIPNNVVLAAAIVAVLGIIIRAVTSEPITGVVSS
jgi:hypothetical protein